MTNAQNIIARALRSTNRAHRQAATAPIEALRETAATRKSWDGMSPGTRKVIEARLALALAS